MKLGKVRPCTKGLLIVNTAKNQKIRSALIAVGGNSLIVSENKQTIPDQYEAAVQTVKRIVDMIEQG